MAASRPSLASAARELLRRRAAQNSLLDFTTFTKPDYSVSWHHRLICRHLDDLVDGRITRLMVFVHPRSGKSELTSRRLPAYFLGKYPDQQVIACSYSSDLSSRMNRDVQRIMDGESYRRLFPGTQLFGKNVRTLASGTWMRNSDFFEVVGKRGSYRSTGVGGGITGMGADLICIDDPIKSAAEARSSTLRTGQWEWFNSDLYTRQQPGCRILLTLTRWHNDDIAGRLLEQAREGGEPWTVLRLPAIAEDTPSHPDDPRSPGEALWPDRFGLEWLERARQQLGPFGWGSLYQQNPTPREGGLFRPGRFILVPCGPAGNGIERVRAWDKGYSSQGDFTAGVLLARTPDGFWWVEDVVRGRWSPGERNEIIRQTAWDDARRYDHGVKTLIERPPGAGTETTDALVRELAGVSVEAVNPRGSKEERAEPAAAMVEGGNVKLVMGKWNRLFLDELAAFPGGENDDQADAFATGFNWLAERLLGGFEQGNHAARQAELGSRVDELFGRE